MSVNLGRNWYYVGWQRWKWGNLCTQDGFDTIWSQNTIIRTTPWHQKLPLEYGPYTGMLCIGSELWWNSQCPQTMHPKSGDNLSQTLHAEARGNIRMADVYCVNAILQLFQKSRWCPRFVPNLSPVNHGIIKIHCQDRMIKCQHLLFEGRSHLRSLVESWSLQIWELSLAHSIDCSVRNLNCLVAPSRAHTLRKWTFTHSITILTVFLAQLMERLSWQSLVAYTVSYNLKINTHGSASKFYSKKKKGVHSH